MTGRKQPLPSGGQVLDALAAQQPLFHAQPVRKTEPLRPLLVGELNPYGADPKYALYPLPEGASGDRLCRLVMGLQRAEYLRRFDRVNLCVGKWSMKAARSEAQRIYDDPPRRIVLLGRKVAAAFGFGAAAPPFSSMRAGEAAIVLLPHPSGLCREWNEPGAFDRARAVLRETGVL